MVATILLALALAAPAVAPPVAGPSATSDHRELGPLRLDQSAGLTWPGLYLPSFTLVNDRRRVHRLTLGLDLPVLRHIAFDVVTVEPSDDPLLRAHGKQVPGGDATSGYAWTGVRIALPRTQWQLRVGRAWMVGPPSAARSMMMGRGGSFQLNLVRPLR